MYAQVNYQKFLIIGMISIILVVGITIPIIYNWGNNNGSNESAEISVKYNDIEIIDGENNFNLGTLNRGQNSDYVFSICNLGNTNLTLSGTPRVSVSGNGYSLFSDADKSTIDKNTTTNFTIRFYAFRHGFHTAQITILNNDHDEGVYNFVIQLGVIFNETIVIDGPNDFNITTSRLETSWLYWAYVSWDSIYLNLGFSATEFPTDPTWDYRVLIYLNAPIFVDSMVIGKNYSNQIPSLPFSATTLIEYRTTNQTTFYNNNGTDWQEYYGFNNTVKRGNKYMEMRIPLTELGIITPTNLSYHLSYIIDDPGSELTYSLCPSTSGSNQFNPPYTQYYDFKIGGVKAPNEHAIV